MHQARRISVVVPVRDDPAGLAMCLDALARQRVDLDVEVIVVDNASTVDLTVAVGSRSGVRLVREPRVGSYVARNRGVAEATGATLAFTDADCRPAEDWLDRAAARLDDVDGDVFLVGRVEVVAHDPGRPTAAELFELANGFPQETYARESFGATANLVVRRAVFDRVGPFRAELVSSGDREWGERAGALGVRAVYAPDVRITHPARRSLRSLAAKHRRVQRGRLQLRRLRDEPCSPWEAVTLAVSPPLPGLLRNLRTVEPRTGRSRRLLVVATLVVHYSKVYERARSGLRRARRA